MQRSTPDRRRMPWDERVAHVVAGRFTYTLWRCVKAVVEGLRGTDARVEER